MRGDGRATFEPREQRRLLVRGVVQGVGFRPFVFRRAQAHRLSGFVRNVRDGVAITVEGSPASLDAFVAELRERPPIPARVEGIAMERAAATGLTEFTIEPSDASGAAAPRVTPDLPTCADCLRELFDAGNRRYRYPYITCAHCGPRFSLVTAFPYDRARTTMASWPMCEECAREFHDPGDRRFHAQPIACPRCGPAVGLWAAGRRSDAGDAAIAGAARLLREGGIVAVKGVGGFHLACDAGNTEAVAALRSRKHRHDQPFALMVRDAARAHALVSLHPDAADLLASAARPIVLAQARVALPGVAPGQSRLGVMLPYTPVQHLLFDAGAPPVLVMTSGNRSTEPMAFEDADALARLQGIADAVLSGDRAIARRVDDSVVMLSQAGPLVVRRARGYAPACVARLPAPGSVLALGGDLKSALTLLSDGAAVTSAHLGDLRHHAARVSFREAIRDLLEMHGVDPADLVLAHDSHPEYASTAIAAEIGGRRRVAVQHHRAHVASVLAERGELSQRVVGIAFDGTGYGDDGTIWGGELFAGSVTKGFARVAHLRPARLPGGDAAARWPVQAAAGFVGDIPGLPDLTRPPFSFSRRFTDARRIAAAGVRTFQTTSVGRLFDAVAALLGFSGEVTFEGQAAMWLESLAAGVEDAVPVPMPFRAAQLDFHPAIGAIVELRRAGASAASIARGFHVGLARATAEAVQSLCASHGSDTVVASGGVFHNVLLLDELKRLTDRSGLRLWVNHQVPAGDGGLSLGQAAIVSGALSGG